MKNLSNKILSLSLVTIMVLGILPTATQSVNSYALGNRVRRDIDEGAEIVEIARLSHEEVQIISKNWGRINYLGGVLAGVKCPPSVLLSVVSEVERWVFEDADRGNGVIIKQLQYPNGCTYCGGSGKLIFYPR